MLTIEHVAQTQSIRNIETQLEYELQRKVVVQEHFDTDPFHISGYREQSRIDAKENVLSITGDQTKYHTDDNYDEMEQTAQNTFNIFKR